MGKKAFQFNIDKGTMGNLKRTAETPIAITKGALGALGGLFGGGGGGGGGAPAGPTGIEETSKKYAEELEKQRLKSTEIGGQLTEQLRQQATGEGPLAGAQLKAAQTRNLAQTLSAAQAGGATPLSTRQMLQQRGQQGQELAQLGLQERLGAQQALGQQLATQAGTGRADIMAGFDISKTPAVMAQERALQQAQIQAQKDAALKQQQSNILGGLIGAGASLLPLAFSDENAKMPPKEESEEQKSKKRRAAFAKAAEGFAKQTSIGEGIAQLGGSIADIVEARKSSKNMMSDEQQKTSSGKKFPDAKAEVNEMMDKLEPKKYRYKNPQAPGAAEGNRYGIMAQDLEKSSLGKTLVKNTAQGKMVDTVQGFGAVLAAQAELNRRLKKLEKKGK